MKNHLQRIVLAICLLVAALATPSVGQRIVGYTTSWTYNADQIDYGSLTHINYSFALPTASGGLMPVENPTKLRSVVSQAHAKGVKVLIAIGGWDIGDGGGNDSRFHTLASTAAGRTNFVNSVVSFIQQYNLDGADIDWEYPDPDGAGNPDANYTALMRQLGTALHSRGWLLTAAVVASSWAGNGISNEVFASVDWLNIMAYDGGNGAAHSPYSYAVSSLDYWLGRGLPKNKAVLGVPFYARPSWSAYSTLLAQGADPYGDVFNGDYYNGINTLKAKTKLAKQRASGVMIWTIDQDVRNQYSLLTAIAQEMGTTGGGGGGGNTATQLEAESYNNMNGVQTESCSEGGQNVGWIDQGDWMAYYNVNFPTSGNYVLEYRVASPSGSQLSSDLNAGTIQLGTVMIPATGGWQAWTTVSQTVYISAGTYNFGVYAPAAGWNLNWIRIRPANATARTEQSTTLITKNQTLTTDYPASSDLTVYPNPARETLTFTTSERAVEGQVRVVNAAGRIVLEKSARLGTLDVSSLPVGVYQLQVATEGGMQIQRFIKE